MDRKSLVILGLIFGGLFLSLFAFLLLAFVAVRSGDDGGGGFGGPSIGVLEIKGPITSSDKALKTLRKFAKEDHVKAILVRIDSPGGAVGPSQEVYSELRYVGAKKKVVCSLGTVAASGGYYIATGCQKIVSNPGTLTGSIGVISQLMYLGDIAHFLKFQSITIKSGKMKDVGNPFREMTEEERAFLQAMQDNVHQQFIKAVADGRNLKVEEVTPIADGRVLTGAQAKELKLVDELGSFNDAVRMTAAMAGIEGEPRLQYPPEEHPFRLEELMRDGGKALARGVIDEISAVAESPLPSTLAPTTGQ